jgi:hypothetical protein
MEGSETGSVKIIKDPDPGSAKTYGSLSLLVAVSLTVRAPPSYLFRTFLCTTYAWKSELAQWNAVTKEAGTVTHLSTLKDEMLVGTFSLPEGPRHEHLSTKKIC